MAIKITDECINCGACEPECPNTAIYEGGAEWKFSEGTSLKGNYTGKNSNKTVDADEANEPVDMDYHKQQWLCPGSTLSRLWDEPQLVEKDWKEGK